MKSWSGAASCRRRWCAASGRREGVFLAALTYALAHAPLGSPLLVMVALLCGMAWGALRAASESLVPALVAHLVWDILVLFWLPLDGG